MDGWYREYPESVDSAFEKELMPRAETENGTVASPGETKESKVLLRIVDYVCRLASYLPRIQVFIPCW